MSNNQLLPSSPHVTDSRPPVITSGLKAETVSACSLGQKSCPRCCPCGFVRRLKALRRDKSQMSGEQAAIGSLNECRGREGRSFTAASRSEWNNPGWLEPKRQASFHRSREMASDLAAAAGGKEGRNKALCASECCAHVCGEVHLQNKCLAFWLCFASQQMWRCWEWKQTCWPALLDNNWLNQSQWNRCEKLHTRQLLTESRSLIRPQLSAETPTWSEVAQN